MARRKFKTLQSKWDLGIRRDTAKEQAPADSVYDATNYLPNIKGVPLRQRGGWRYASDPILTDYSTHAGIHANFAGTQKLLVIVRVSSSGTYELRDVPASGAATDLGSTGADPPWQNPVWFKDSVIMPHNHGITPLKYNPTAGHVALQNGPPLARYATAYKQRLLMASGEAGGTTYPNRIWFSGANNPDSWDLTNHYYDVEAPILGVGGLRASALIFHGDRVTRVRGTTPGAVSLGGDIEIDHNFFLVGCANAQSITYYQENIIWADAHGVYMSDGAAFVDLTERGGIRNLWSYDPTTQHIATGVVDDWLFVVLTNTSTRDWEASWACYIPRRAWYKVSNFPFRALFPKSGTAGSELYAAMSTVARVAKLGNVIYPAQETLSSEDDDGTDILPQLETQFYRDLPGNIQQANVRVGYALRESGAFVPDIDVSAYVMPGRSTLHPLASLPLTSTDTNQRTGYKRKSLRVGKRGEGISLVLSRTGDRAQEIDIYDIALEYDDLPGYA